MSIAELKGWHMLSGCYVREIPGGTGEDEIGDNGNHRLSGINIRSNQGIPTREEKRERERERV